MTLYNRRAKVLEFPQSPIGDRKDHQMSAHRLRCPACHAPLDVVACTTIREYHPGYHVRGEPLPEHEVPTTVTACSACEFAIDLEYSNRAPRTPASLATEIRLLLKQMR